MRSRQTTVGAGSTRKVWWRCARCGHEWRTTPWLHRLEGTGCPVCGCRRTSEYKTRVARERSLAVRHPELLAEWHPTRNDGLDPYTVGAARSPRAATEARQGRSFNRSSEPASTGERFQSASINRRATVLGAPRPLRHARQEPRVCRGFEATERAGQDANRDVMARLLEGLLEPLGQEARRRAATAIGQSAGSGLASSPGSVYPRPDDAT